MAFTLYSLLQAALLCVNAVLHEERFLKNFGWGKDQGIGGFGEEPGIKSQLMNLIRSVKTVMRRGKKESLRGDRMKNKGRSVD
uniref:Immediate early response 3-interacting protein 1 n=1 Tax=Urocitellus parryii TaxID=9999 RepID=A0A8D2KJ90_UROPR